MAGEKQEAVNLVCPYKIPTGERTELVTWGEIEVKYKILMCFCLYFLMAKRPKFIYKLGG